MDRTPLVGLLPISAAVTGAVAGYAWPRRATTGAGAFAATMLVVAGWSLAAALEVASADLTARGVWASVQVLSFAVAPVTWLAMTLQYSGQGRWLTRARLALLLVLPAITWVLVGTNGLHRLVWRDVLLANSGPASAAGSAYGPWFWVHLGYSEALLLASAVMLAALTLRVPSAGRRQPLVLLVAVLLLLLVIPLHALGLLSVSAVDPSPLFFGLSGVGLAWALFHFRPFDLLPNVHSSVVQNVSDGVVVLDTRNRVLDLNPAAERITGYQAATVVGQSADHLLGQWPELAELSRESYLVETEQTNGNGVAHYEVRLSPLLDHHGSLSGRVIVWHDITEHKRAQAELLQQQRALTLLEERERVARELHDNVGQVLGYVNTQAQAAREMLAHEQSPAADAHLARLVSVVQDAQVDIREYILGVKAAVATGLGLIPALEQYLGRLSQHTSLQTNLIVPPELREGVLSPAVELQLLRIIQEALTNVRKHALARRVRVIFTVQADRVQVAVEDDGRGFDPEQLAVYGGRTFGLRSMHERAQEIDGSLQVRSTPGQGTRVIVRVPLGEARSDR